jgi:acetoin utilization deacetylase AcuC-like enzyme
MLIVHSPRCLEYSAIGHPESPERIETAVALLQENRHRWLVAEPCPEQDVLRVHTPAVVEAVKTGQVFDADTPAFPNIYELALLAAGAAAQAAEKSLAGERAFSLMRPPGHHAERDRVMGFCYFNNVAIAVAKVLSEGSVQKVAILDFDCHHGNGTEDIFLGDRRVLFISLHQSPCYPGTGLASRHNCLNYPLQPGTGPSEFLEAIDNALARIGAFKPDILAISAGFDTYKDDPITQMALEIDTYCDIGRRIAQFCHVAKSSLPLPCFAVLEGGYSRDFARCVKAFLDGLEL